MTDPLSSTDRTPRCIPTCAVCGREFRMPVAQYIRNGAGQCCGRSVTLDPFLLDDDEPHPWSGDAEPEVPSVRPPACGKEFAPGQICVSDAGHDGECDDVPY